MAYRKPRPTRALRPSAKKSSIPEAQPGQQMELDSPVETPHSGPSLEQQAEVLPQQPSSGVAAGAQLMLPPSQEGSDSALRLGAGQPAPLGDIDPLPRTMTPFSPFLPMAGSDDCFDERFPLQERLDRVKMIREHFQANKTSWELHGKRPCTVPGCKDREHPPPCWLTPEGLQKSGFLKKAKKLMRKERVTKKAAEDLVAPEEVQGNEAEDPASQEEEGNEAEVPASQEEEGEKAEDLAPKPKSKGKGKKGGKYRTCFNCAKTHDVSQGCRTPDCKRSPPCGLAHHGGESCSAARQRFAKAGLLTKERGKVGLPEAAFDKVKKLALSRGVSAGQMDDIVAALTQQAEQEDAPKGKSKKSAPKGKLTKGAPKGKPLEKKRKADAKAKSDDRESEDEAMADASDGEPAAKRQKEVLPIRQKGSKAKGSRGLKGVYSAR